MKDTTQLFYSLENAGFIEVIGPTNSSIKNEGNIDSIKHEIWGLAVVVNDIYELKNILHVCAFNFDRFLNLY